MAKLLESLVPLLEKVVGFLSRRLAAIVALVVVFILYPDMQISMQILAAVCVIAFVISQTYLDGKKVVRVTAKAKMILFAFLMSGLLAAPAANAELLPFIDRLDLQAGPGVEIVDLDPLTFDPVLLTTAKVYERYKLELRIGGLLSDTRRALIFNVARSLSDLILRDDSGEEKSLLPTIGIWFAGDVRKDEAGDYGVDFIWGVNAVMAEF